MKSAVLTILALAIALQVPLDARAGDLLLSTSQDITYDPNVFRQKKDKQSDVIFRVVPSFRLSDKQERLSYELAYGVPIERGIKTYKEIQFDHTPRIKANYKLTGRTGFFLNDSFRYANLRDDFTTTEETASESPEGNIIEVTDSEKRTVITNSFSAGVNHRFTPHLSGRWSVSYAFYDSNDPDRSDNNTIGSGSSFNYKLSARHSFNAGFGMNRQTFDDRPGFPGSTTDFYRVSAGWRWRISESTSFSVNLAPNFVVSQQDKPDPVRKIAAFPNITVLKGPQIYYNVANPVTGEGEDVYAPTGSVLYPVYNSCPGTSPDTRVFNGCGFRVLVNDPGNASGGFFSTNSLRQSDDLVYTPLPGGLTLVQNGGAATRFDDPVTAIGMIDPTANVEAMFVQNPQSDRNTTLTLFGNASLSHRWTPMHTTAFNYSRRESTASGLGGSSTVDSVSLTHSWKIDGDWLLRLRTDWVTRESLFPQNQTFVTANLDEAIDAATGIQVATALDGPGGLVSVESNRALDTTNYSAVATLSRRLTPKLTGSLRGLYTRQESKSQVNSDVSTFDTWEVKLSFTYSFDAIRLWR